MRFMMMVRSRENSGAPPKELMEAISKLSEEGKNGGSLVASGGLAPTAGSARVRVSQGRLTVMDGPFTETKEVVGGYAVMEFKSKQEALDSAVQFMELHRKHWPGWEGETEVREIFGPEDYRSKGGRMTLQPGLAPHE